MSEANFKNATHYTTKPKTNKPNFKFKNLVYILLFCKIIIYICISVQCVRCVQSYRSICAPKKFKNSAKIP